MPKIPQKNCMVPLALPLHPVRLSAGTRGEVLVYDPLRRRTVMLTPEEWVRQHFVAHMIADLGYPPSLMANEVSINLNGLARRCDTVVWNRRDASPLMIVEYKAPSVKLTAAVLQQIARYNLELQAPYLMISNGLQHLCLRLKADKTSYEALSGLPSYSNL